MIHQLTRITIATEYGHLSATVEPGGKWYFYDHNLQDYEIAPLKDLLEQLDRIFPGGKYGVGI